MIPRRQTNTPTQLYVWGSDSHGQLGLPQANARVHNLPKQVTLLHAIKTISCGEKHIAFITHEGDVFTQGCNADGKLGIDDKSVKWSNVPVKVNLPLPATKIHCGLSHTLCLLENGDVYAWGYGEYGALGVGEFRTKFRPIRVYLEMVRTKQISAGAMHSSFLTVSGDLYMCGSNDYGELGNPRRDKLSVPTLIPWKSRFVEVSCGIFYTLMLDENGLVYAMGNNKYGQLGTGSKNPESQPTLLKALQNEYIVKIYSGYHSGALNDKGELFLWGSGTFGEFVRPMKVKKPYSFVDLSIGGFFGCAVDSRHNVYTWGNNNSGELGLGHFENCKELTEVSCLRGKCIDRVFCGVNFVFAVVSQNAGTLSIPQTHHRSISQNYHTTRQASEQVTRAPQKPSLRQYTQVSQPSSRPNIEGGVRELKNTIWELQQKQRNLQAQRRTLEDKLEVLAKDYEKLCGKYDMIEVIVNQKEKIIGIYQNKIKELSKNSAQQELLVENKLLKQDINRITESMNRNTQNLTDKIRQKDQIIARLERSQIDLLQEASLMKNELKLSQNLLKDRLDQDRSVSFRQKKLDNDYEDIIRKKDSQIADLANQNSNLSKQISRLTADMLRKQENLKTTSSKIEILLKQKEQEEITFIKRINQLETMLKEKDDEIAVTKKGMPSPTRASRQQSTIRQLNDEVRIKDEAIAGLKKELKEMASLGDLKTERSSLFEAIKFENEQLRDQLLLKEQLVDRLSQEMKSKQESLKRLTEDYLKPMPVVGASTAPELKILLENMSRKFQSAVRSKEQTQCNLTRELQKQITLSTKLRAQVDQLSFQLRRSQFELEQLKFLSVEKQKVLEADFKALSSYRSTMQGKDIEAFEKSYLVKTFQEELERKKDEVFLEKEAQKKSDEVIKRLSDETVQLKKLLGTTEAALQVSNDEAELFKGEIDRLKKIKKDFEARQVEQVQTFEKNQELQTKVDLVNAQLALKTKTIKDLQKQIRQENESALNREQELSTELRKLKQTKSRLSSQLKQVQDEKNRAVQKMELAISQSCRQKQNAVALIKKAENASRALQAERSSKQTQDSEILDLKKQLTRTRIQKQQLSRSMQVLQSDYKACQNKCSQWQEKVSGFEKEWQSIQSQLQTNKDENRRLREQVAQLTETMSQQKHINSELTSANAEFARNEIEYVNKIEQLQRRFINQKNQTDDYKPRYQALLQRNKELDERNAQLAAMLNKAIQKHALEYKDKVLGDVAKNAGNIFEHLKESVVLTSNKKKRQSHSQSQQQQQSVTEHIQQSENLKTISGQKSPLKDTKKQDPYKRLMSAKITDHKRRISESAFKLVELLDVDKDSKNQTDNMEDYQKINDRIESIEMQKSNLLAKINNYSEKLKIL